MHASSHVIFGKATSRQRDHRSDTRVLHGSRPAGPSASITLPKARLVFEKVTLVYGLVECSVVLLPPAAPFSCCHTEKLLGVVPRSASDVVAHLKGVDNMVQGEVVGWFVGWSAPVGPRWAGLWLVGAAVKAHSCVAADVSHSK